MMKQNQKRMAEMDKEAKDFLERIFSRQAGNFPQIEEVSLPILAHALARVIEFLNVIRQLDEIKESYGSDIDLFKFRDSFEKNVVVSALKAAFFHPEATGFKTMEELLEKLEFRSASSFIYHFIAEYLIKKFFLLYPEIRCFTYLIRDLAADAVFYSEKYRSHQKQQMLYSKIRYESGRLLFGEGHPVEMCLKQKHVEKFYASTESMSSGIDLKALQERWTLMNDNAMCSDRRKELFGDGMFTRI